MWRAAMRPDASSLCSKVRAVNFGNRTKKRARTTQLSRKSGFPRSSLLRGTLGCRASRDEGVFAERRVFVGRALVERFDRGLRRKDPGALRRGIMFEVLPYGRARR